MALVMKMDRKYIIRRRWAVVIALPLLILALMAFYQVATHIWWVEGQGYCWGTMEQCFPEMFGKE